jgi:hypothetical protein
MGWTWSDRVGIALLAALAALILITIALVAIGAARGRLTRAVCAWAGVALAGAIAALGFGCVTPILSDGSTCI